jgi:hypothetical protein
MFQVSPARVTPFDQPRLCSNMGMRAFALLGAVAVGCARASPTNKIDTIVVMM